MSADHPSRIVHRADAQRILNLPARTFARLEAEGVIVPSKRGKPGTPSEYDVGAITSAYIRYLSAHSGWTAEREARAHRDQAQAAFTTLRVKERLGQLVDAADVERTWSEMLIGVRNTVLSLPTRIRQRLPHLTLGDLNVMDAVVREILAEAATEASGNGKDQP